jgi:outer membrane protein
MKNKVMITALAVLVGAFPLLLRGQDAPATAGAKIGVINIQEAIFTTAEGKKAFADLQTKYKPRQQEIAQEQQEVTALQDQLQKQATTLSDDEERRMTRELTDKQKNLKRMTDDAQSDFTNDRDDILNRIGKKMVAVIDDFAKQKGYTLIFDPAGAQVPVYYAAQGVDITADIVKMYDAAHPVVTAAAPAPASSAAKPKQ